MMAPLLRLLLACVTLGHLGADAASGVIVNQLAPSVTAVNGFSWANCDAETLPARIKTLTVLPDPVIFPGEITVSTILNTTVALTTPLKVDITAEKEILGEWVKIPCLDGVGSCTYDDVCNMLDQLIQPGQRCPPPLDTYGIPCHCPFKAGSYYLPVSSFYIPSLSLPSWFTKGNYAVKLVLSNGKKEIGCAKLTFSIAVSYSHWL